MSGAAATRFLHAIAQGLSTMALYRDGHPARERTLDIAYEQLELLRQSDPLPVFSFLAGEVIYRNEALRELKDWEWAGRLSQAGIQRLEIMAQVDRAEFEEFLDEVLARLALSVVDSATQRPGRLSGIRFGTIGVKGVTGDARIDLPTTATINYTLADEAETVRWINAEVEERATLPLLEAEAVVRSLSVAMHGDSEIIIPLLQLKEFDQYTTTHSTNVSVLTMALAEYLGLGARDVRSYGVAGLLHDLGKVRIPREILIKPGKLTEEERDVMRAHPAEGARIILAREQRLDLAAAVAYEHHIVLNGGGGYPSLHYHRDCHHGSKLVHVCDFYDALRTNRPYRGAWESDKVLAYIEAGLGREFDADAGLAFVQMMREWGQRSVVVDESTPIRSDVRIVGAQHSRTSGGQPAVAATQVPPAKPQADPLAPSP
ncbi:MAG TPA: HD domain-containing phosphohydrolase [Gemmatimonadales bacterium]|nr:HD domain-containing phosphohydrolase [Gemmatimonadales bacterium]